MTGDGLRTRHGETPRGAVRRAVSDWFVAWYMGRVAGRYCPCEWPIKSKRLIHLCGRIDDAYARHDYRNFVGFFLNETRSTSSSDFRIEVDTRRKRHTDG